MNIYTVVIEKNGIQISLGNVDAVDEEEAKANILKMWKRFNIKNILKDKAVTLKITKE
jgi:hypothetical protein